MAGEERVQMAAELIHELMGDDLGFAIIVWVPGKESGEGGVAYACPPDHKGTAPRALTTAAQVMAMGKTVGVA